MSALRLSLRNLPGARAWLLAILCILILLPDTASAAPLNCRINVKPVNFGAYVPGSSTDVDANGEIWPDFSGDYELVGSAHNDSRTREADSEAAMANRRPALEGTHPNATE